MNEFTPEATELMTKAARAQDVMNEVARMLWALGYDAEIYVRQDFAQGRAIPSIAFATTKAE